MGFDIDKLTRKELEEASSIQSKYDLSEDQLATAWKVRNESIKQGVNPAFTLPMFYAESRFKQSATSPKGARGVSQLMPNTGKDLNVDVEDEDQNIYGGVKYIKKLMENKDIGSDPYKILAAYNAGPATPYIKSEKVEDLPDETKGYIHDILKRENLDDFPKDILEYKEPTQTAVDVPATVPDASSDKSSGKNAEPLTNNVPLPAQQLAGAVAGVSASTPIQWAVAKGMGQYKAGEKAVEEALERTSKNRNREDELGRIEPHMTEEKPISSQFNLSGKSQSNLPHEEVETPLSREVTQQNAAAQRAARTREANENAKSVGLSTDKPLAEFGDIASTKSGKVLISSKELEAQKAAKIEKWNQALEAAKNSGAEWQKIVEDANMLWKHGDADQKASAEGFLNKIWGKLKTTGEKISNTGKIVSEIGKYPAKIANAAAIVGAAVPTAWDEYKNDNPEAAGAILGAGAVLGGLSSIFPKTSTGLMTAGSALYDITHPQEAAAAVTNADVSPTGFAGMPEQYESTFPQLQTPQTVAPGWQMVGNSLQRANALGGRGFVNPPLANQSPSNQSSGLDSLQQQPSNSPTSNQDPNFSPSAGDSWDNQ